MSSTQTDTWALWRLGPSPADFDLANVRVVTADRVLDGARVVVRDGLIADVSTGPATGVAALDGGGMLVVPGVVDVHSDALEKERLPRPNAGVPWEFALASLEGRLVSAGVTTIFHGAAFQHQTYRGGSRSVETAGEVCDLIDTARSYRVDHRVLHRLDVLSEPGAEALRRRLASLPAGDPPPLVSHEDHTPGQGQYADPTYMVNYIVEADGRTEEQAWADVDRLMADGEHWNPIRRANLDWLGGLARDGKIRLVGHDPDGVATVDGIVERGGAIAEFPTTMEAARRARDRGLLIVAGAPNLLRGQSHSGNLAAGELLAAGLLDAVASDYLPSALLGSVWAAVLQDVLDLPTGIRLVSSGPARAAGLEDRGVLAPGYRADFAVIDDRISAWPHVIATIRAGAQA